MGRRLSAGVLAVTAVSTACADDGILYYNGAPRMMHGESNITMVREFVEVKIGWKSARVHCRFVFHNDGPATKARIGFPDGADAPDDDGTYRSSLEHFESKVDGKPISVRAEQSRDTGNGPTVYRVKVVPFERGQTRVVEDSYDVWLSGGATNSGGLYLSEFTYTMWSGGSWKGNIGEATVQVDMVGKNFHRVKLVPIARFGEPTQWTKLGKLPSNSVLWSGFAYPTASGSSLAISKKLSDP